MAVWSCFYFLFFGIHRSLQQGCAYVQEENVSKDWLLLAWKAVCILYVPFHLKKTAGISAGWMFS